MVVAHTFLQHRVRAAIVAISALANGVLSGRWEAEINSELRTFFARKGLSLSELHLVGDECLRNAKLMLLPSSKGEGSEAGPMLDLLAAVLIAEASYQAEEDGSGDGGKPRHDGEVSLSSLTSETLLSSKSVGGVQWGRGGILPLLVFLEDTIPAFRPKSRNNACSRLVQVLNTKRGGGSSLGRSSYLEEEGDLNSSSLVSTGDLPGVLRQTIRLCGAAAERRHSKVEGSGDDKEEARQWAFAVREVHAIIPAAFVPTAELVGCQALCHSPHAVKEILEFIRLHPHSSGRHFDLAMLLILAQEANILETCALPLLRGGTKHRAVIDSAVAEILTADPSPQLLLRRTLSHGGCGGSSSSSFPSSGSDGSSVIESPSLTATSVPRGMQLLRIAERWMEFSPPSTQKQQQQTAAASDNTSSSGEPLQTAIILAIFDTVPEARSNILRMVLGGLTVSDCELGEHARQRYLRTWEAMASASRIESLSPHTAVVAEALPGFFHIPIHSAMTAMQGCLRLAGIGNENGNRLGGSHSSFAGAILSACRKSLVQSDTRGRVLAMHILASLAGTRTFSARKEAERAVVMGLHASIPLPAKSAAYSAIGECNGVPVTLVNALRRRLVRYLSPPPPRLRKVRAGHSGVVFVPLRVIEVDESGKGGGRICCARDSIGHLLRCVWRLEADTGCHTHLASTVLGTIPPDSLSSGTASINAPQAGLEFASAVVEFLRCGAICRFIAESRVIELNTQETEEVKQDEDEERNEVEQEAEQCNPSLVKMPHRLALIAVLSEALVGCLTYGKFTCNWIAECQASLLLLCLRGLSCDALKDCKCSNTIQSPPRTTGGSLAMVDGKMSSQIAAETLLTLNQGLSAAESLLLPLLLGCKAAMGLLRKWYLLQHMKQWNAEEGNGDDIENSPWVSIPEWVQWLGLERCAECLQLCLERGRYSDMPTSHAGKLLMAVHCTLSSTCCRSNSEAQSRVDMDLMLEEEKIDPFGSYFPPEFLPLVSSSVLDSFIGSKDGPKGIAAAAEAMQSMELPPPAHQRAWSAVLAALMSVLASVGDVSLWTATLSTPLCREMARCLRSGLESDGLTIQVVKRILDIIEMVKGSGAASCEGSSTCSCGYELLTILRCKKIKQLHLFRRVMYGALRRDAGIPLCTVQDVATQGLSFLIADKQDISKKGQKNQDDSNSSDNEEEMHSNANGASHSICSPNQKPQQPQQQQSMLRIPNHQAGLLVITATVTRLEEEAAANEGKGRIGSGDSKVVQGEKTLPLLATLLGSKKRTPDLNLNLNLEECQTTTTYPIFSLPEAVQGRVASLIEGVFMKGRSETFQTVAILNRLKKQLSSPNAKPLGEEQVLLQLLNATVELMREGFVSVVHLWIDSGAGGGDRGVTLRHRLGRLIFNTERWELVIGDLVTRIQPFLTDPLRSLLPQPICNVMEELIQVGRNMKLVGSTMPTRQTFNDEESGGVLTIRRKKTKKRLRSRNTTIDDWLGDETGGGDAYADLENFIM